MEPTSRELPAPARLDLETRGDFRRAAVELLGQMREGAGTLVVDLAATTAIDSSGLGTLIMVRRHAHTRQQTIRLRHANDEIRLLLSLTKLDKLFEIDDGGPP